MNAVARARMRSVLLAVATVFIFACGALGPSGASGNSGNNAGGTGGGGGAFQPATPISDVCSLLTISDVQTVLPGARPGAEQQTPDTAAYGFWSRDCKWDVSDTSVQSIELVVFGATTEQGLLGIKAAAQSHKTNSSVSGLGTEAHFWAEDTDNGLWALNGSVSVDITAYFLTPMLTEAQLHPLVAKVLGEIK